MVKHWDWFFPCVSSSIKNGTNLIGSESRVRLTFSNVGERLKRRTWKSDKFNGGTVAGRDYHKEEAGLL